MSPHVADTICLVVALILPIPLILRWNLFGAFLGALVVWSSLILAGIILSKLDHERETSMLDHIWILFGWAGGLIYCLPIYGMKRAAIWLWRVLSAPAKSGYR